jgi:endonuclease/exonuclease/phosphatase family metal-dependent hydrolase
VRLVALAAAPAVAFIASACAPTVNLSDPAGPKFVGCFAPAAPDTGVPGPLRVVTFNVKLGREVDRAIEVLQSDSLRNADVVALQEMDEAGVVRIARALRLNYVYVPGVVHPTDHRYFGPALLSRWPIERAWKLALPHLGRFRHQQRVAAAALLRVHGQALQVYAVHLETQLRVSDAQRADQVRAIIADAANTTAPVIIAGDFNSYDVGPVLTRAGYRWMTELAGPSISVFSWDHIFVRGLAAADPPSVGVVARVHGASDHHPVWAVVRMKS